MGDGLALTRGPALHSPHRPGDTDGAAGLEHAAIGPVRVPVEVEDAPFVVLRVELAGDQLMMTLNDLSRDLLAPDTIRFGADGAPYCGVKGARFEARCSRAAAYQFLQHVESDESGGTASLRLGDRRYPLPGLGADGSRCATSAPQ